MYLYFFISSVLLPLVCLAVFLKASLYNRQTVFINAQHTWLIFQITCARPHATVYGCRLCTPALEVTNSLQHPSAQSRKLFGEKNCCKVYHTVRTLILMTCRRIAWHSSFITYETVLNIPNVSVSSLHTGDASKSISKILKIWKSIFYCETHRIYLNAISGLRMWIVTWYRFSNKNFADWFDSVIFVEAYYLKTDMCKSQSLESRSQSTRSSKLAARLQLSIVVNERLFPFCKHLEECVALLFYICAKLSQQKRKACGWNLDSSIHLCRLCGD